MFHDDELTSATKEGMKLRYTPKCGCSPTNEYPTSDWHAPVDKSHLLKTYPDFHPSIRAVLK